MSLAAKAARAADPVFIATVQMACASVAVTVLKNEGASAPSKKAAAYFLREPEMLARRIALMVAANDAVDDETTDQALLTLIGQSWPVLAGVLLPS